MNKALRKPTVAKAVLFGALAAAALALSACNTVSGVGKDIQEISENTKNMIEN